MRAEFFRREEPERSVAVAQWDGVRAEIRGADDDVRASVERILRRSSVVVDDPSRRALGTSGPVVVEPGDLDWFFAAAWVRGEEEGLSVRFATDTPGGWDPAGFYRRMGDWVGDRESLEGVTHPAGWR